MWQNYVSFTLCSCLCFLLTAFDTHTPVSAINAQVTCSHVTPLFSLFIYLSILPPPPSFWLRCLQRSALSGSAGLNVVREALLKAPQPISLVQMHWVSSKFHANRHILFKQLWGYPQKEASLPLSVLPVSLSWNHQSHDVQDDTEWLGRHTNFSNMSAIFTLFQICLISFHVTGNGQPMCLWPLLHVCNIGVLYIYWDIRMHRTRLPYINMEYIFSDVYSCTHGEISMFIN